MFLFMCFARTLKVHALKVHARARTRARADARVPVHSDVHAQCNVCLIIFVTPVACAARADAVCLSRRSAFLGVQSGSEGHDSSDTHSSLLSEGDKGCVNSCLRVSAESWDGDRAVFMISTRGMRNVQVKPNPNPSGNSLKLTHGSWI